MCIYLLYCLIRYNICDYYNNAFSFHFIYFTIFYNSIRISLQSLSEMTPSESRGLATNESDDGREAFPSATGKPKQPPKMNKRPTKTTCPPKRTSGDQVHHAISGKCE